MGFIITFVQQKDTLGKTAILAHLAHSWAHAGKTVGLIELDQKRPIATWANLGRNLNMTLKESPDWRILPDVRESAKHHDLTLIDCPNIIDAGLHSAVKASDLLIVPCQPTGMAVWSAKAILSACKTERTPARVLINRVSAHNGKLDKIMADLHKTGAVVFQTHLDNKVAFSAEILDAGQTSNSASAHDEIEILRREIDQTLASL